MNLYRKIVTGMWWTGGTLAVASVVVAALGNDAAPWARAGLGLVGLALVLYMFEPIE